GGRARGRFGRGGEMGGEVQRGGKGGRGGLRRDERRGAALLGGNAGFAARGRRGRHGRAEYDTEHRMTSGRHEKPPAGGVTAHTIPREPAHKGALTRRRYRALAPPCP